MPLSPSANVRRTLPPLVLHIVIPLLPVPEITRSSTSPLPPVKLEPRYNLPLESMRSLSVVDCAPSAVVQNESRPGVSFDPGVPSTIPLISAIRDVKSVPSPAVHPICPTKSSSCTMVAPVGEPDLCLDN